MCMSHTLLSRIRTTSCVVPASISRKTRHIFRSSSKNCRNKYLSTRCEHIASENLKYIEIWKARGTFNEEFKRVRIGFGTFEREKYMLS